MNTKSSTRRTFVIGMTGAAAAYACKREPKVTVGGAASAQHPVVEGVVPKRRLGKTGVEVSMIGLGGFHIGSKVSEKESILLIRRAVDNGITFLDNCWDYNDGDSEVRMGKALRDGYRNRAFLMTKLDGRTERSASEQLEQSLRRLQTDHIDLVQIHEVIRMSDPDRCFAPGGTLDALTKAKKAGKLRFIGFTGHKDPAIHLAMLDAAKKHGFAFDTVQMPLNVMDHHYKSFRHEVLPVLTANDIGVLGMKSMGSGDILKSGVVTPEECLRYALSLPTSVVICGTDSEKVLDQNLRIARNFRPFSEAELSALLARTAPSAAEGKYEEFKTNQKYDGTGRNPHWLEEARI